jgi:hypothetical protein
VFDLDGDTKDTWVIVVQTRETLHPIRDSVHYACVHRTSYKLSRERVGVTNLVGRGLWCPSLCGLSLVQASVCERVVGRGMWCPTPCDLRLVQTSVCV